VFVDDTIVQDGPKIKASNSCSYLHQIWMIDWAGFNVSTNTV